MIKRTNPVGSRWRTTSARVSRLTFALGLAVVSACAEPAVSGAHLPILWAIAIAGAVVVAAIPPLAKTCAKITVPWWAIAITSVVLVVLWTSFAAPLIVAVGSMLITGRTM